MKKLLFINNRTTDIKLLFDVISDKFKDITILGVCTEINKALGVILKHKPDIIIFATDDFVAENTPLFLHINIMNIETIYVLPSIKFEPYRNTRIIPCIISNPYNADDIKQALTYSMGCLKKKDEDAERLAAKSNDTVLEEKEFIFSFENCFWYGPKRKGGWKKKIEISHCISHRNTVESFSDNNTSFSIYHTMKFMKKEFKDYDFISTGQSFLVCLHKVVCFDWIEGKWVDMPNHHRVPITDDYRKNTMKILNRI